MPLRADVRAERRAQILDTAASVFAHHGFHQARIDDIVAASGLSKGAIYWYFKSKNDIIIAIIGRFFASEHSAFPALLSDTASPARARVLGFAHQVASNITAIDATNLLPLFHDFYALAARDSTVRQAIQHYLASNRTLIAHIIQQGIERGEFRAVDAQAMAEAIIALHEGMILLWSIQSADQRGDLCQVLHAALAHLLDGIAAPHT